MLPDYVNNDLQTSKTNRIHFFSSLFTAYKILHIFYAVKLINDEENAGKFILEKDAEPNEPSNHEQQRTPAQQQPGPTKLQQQQKVAAVV